MKTSHSIAIFMASSFLFCLSGCQKAEHAAEERHKLVLTTPEIKDVVNTQEYVCQIHSRRHIEVRALETGYLEAIPVKEGQAVKEKELMFKVVPVLYRAKYDTEKAEAEKEQIEYNNTHKLYEQHVVSEQDVKLAEAKLSKALAQVKLAEAELNFTEIKAPFEGIIDRLHSQQGSLVEEGDVLTTLSDNQVMWVYFNVPEARYLEYKAEMGREDDGLRVELVLANGSKFDYSGKISAIEADFNNQTGNIAFRADFPNSNGLLRHGQTGTVQIHRTLHDVTVIPQRATFDILDKRFVFVVDKDDVIHQREIKVQSEMEDVFVVGSGLEKDDRFVLEGVRQAHDGEKAEYEVRKPEEVLAKLKNRAE